MCLYLFLISRTDVQPVEWVKMHTLGKSVKTSLILVVLIVIYNNRKYILLICEVTVFVFKYLCV